MSEQDSPLIQLSSLKFLAGCLALSALIVIWGAAHPLPPILVAAEVMLTVAGLFLFGSFKYRIDKNAMTYGAVIVIAATFWTSWWPRSALQANLGAQGAVALGNFALEKFLTFKGLEEIVHLDTMLFILGLTYFVAVISQTRMLESISFKILASARGGMLPTIAVITALVSLASGVLCGVAMIGLVIRILVILLFLTRVDDVEVIFFVIVSTIVTTVCGMWLAYGEPPNLIMKTNLQPFLTDGFFLRYCLPMAVVSWLVLYFNFRKILGGRVVDLERIPFFDLHTADLRFLQVMRHGEVLTPLEFVEERASEFGRWHDAVLKLLHEGRSLGGSLIAAGVPPDVRRKLLGEYISEDLAEEADRYFETAVRENVRHAHPAGQRLYETMERVRTMRVRTQKVGALGFIPFAALLAWHAFNHEVPLFLSSFAAFAVAFFAIANIPKMRQLAMKEAWIEYKEYLFLFPLFVSIALLTRTGFFDQLGAMLHDGIEHLGASAVAIIQFLGATFLSAILDNNVVADFASRALHELPAGLMHLFAMAQIAGYALGGCWTHIGSAQSVVAYAFIQRDIRPSFTPVEWIKLVTPIILQTMAAAGAIIVLEGALLGVLH